MALTYVEGGRVRYRAVMVIVKQLCVVVSLFDAIS